MKVLYLLGNYPKPSETYVAAEIAFMLRQGVEIEVFAPGGGAPGAEAQVPVHRGTVKEAFDRFRPDLVHVHYLVVHHDAIEEAGRRGIPVTVRGHSFDFSPENVRALSGRKCVKRIYLFPHFAGRCSGDPKVVPLPVSFDPALFYPERKDREAVVRTAAGKANKGLGDFIKAYEHCPKHRFTLIVDPVDRAFMEDLKLSASLRGVALYVGMPNAWTASLIRQAGIYFSTNDPAGHPFGMPVSIAEAMAAGCLVLVRDSEAARSYVGDGGLYYSSVQDAVRLLHESEAWDDAQWDAVRQRAVARAAAFTAEKVLPSLLGDWKSIVG